MKYISELGCGVKSWLSNIIPALTCPGGSDTNEAMNWQDRMKVATGAARGLRYLHEDCRVGSIFHGNFRPKSILLTHEFEAMVSTTIFYFFWLKSQQVPVFKFLCILPNWKLRLQANYV